MVEATRTRGAVPRSRGLPLPRAPFKGSLVWQERTGPGPQARLMPMGPARPCHVPTCPRLNCTEHPVPDWRPLVGPPPPRIRGRKLQPLRAALFARSPWCVRCLVEGRRTKATIRDHVVALAEGGRDDATNEQAICEACHEGKTQAESARGTRDQYR